MVFRSGLLLLLVLLAGCGTGGESGGGSGDELRVYRHSFDQAPTSLDPAQSAIVYSNFLVLNIYDTLYSYKYLERPYALKPNLAASMPEVADDGLTYTIRIKRGARFADDPAFEGGSGREVVAEDFVYSLKRHFDPRTLSQGAWFWQSRIVGLDDWGRAGADYDAPVDGLKATDRYTIEIRLLRPYPQLVHTLTQGFSAIVPREAVEKYGRELSVNPVGSGPFLLRRFDTTKAVMVPNPNFRKEPVDLAFEGYAESLHAGLGLEAIDGRSPPFIDRFEVDFIGDDAARMTALTNGTEVQFARVPSSQYDVFFADKKSMKLKDEYAQFLNVISIVEPAVVFQAFNLDRPEIGYSDDPQQNERNKALRCAMIKAFDWQQRNDTFYSGVGEIFPGIIPSAVPEHDTSLDRYSVTADPEEARRILAAAGWTPQNLPEIVYGIPASVRQTQMFEQFRGFMQKIGFSPEKIVVKNYPTFGDINEAWKRSQLPIVVQAWNLDYPDAENVLQLFYGPNGSPGSNNANYRNAEYDELYRRSSVMLASPERTAIYRNMNKMLIDDCVAFAGLSRKIVLAWHKDVIAYPDRNVVGGFWARFVDLQTPASP